MVIFTHDDGVDLAKSAASSWRARFPVHQCAAAPCDGTFACAGCLRVVGWCLGSCDALGGEHCDDCYIDRLAVLEGVKQGLNTRAALSATRNRSVWRRPPTVVADELCEDGFLALARNGRFVLSASGRAQL